MAKQQKLNPSQVALLKALAASKTPLTHEALEKKADCAASPANLGPVYAETLESYPDSLYGRKLAVPAKHEGEPLVWAATAKGAEVAKKMLAKPRLTGDKIPIKTLDKVLREYRQFRTYGLESYTDAEVKEVRDLCGKFPDMTLDSVRKQMLNRRKLGAFTDPEARKRDLAKRILKGIGKEGTLKKGLLTAAQIATLEKLAGL